MSDTQKTFKVASPEVQAKALRLIAQDRVVAHKHAKKVYTVFGDTGPYDVELTVSWRRRNSVRKIYSVNCDCQAGHNNLVCSHSIAAVLLAQREGYKPA
jgi:hypothetical protein